jgi:hypothetical protein
MAVTRTRLETAAQGRRGKEPATRGGAETVSRGPRSGE